MAWTTTPLLLLTEIGAAELLAARSGPFGDSLSRQLVPSEWVWFATTTTVLLTIWFTVHRIVACRAWRSCFAVARTTLVFPVRNNELKRLIELSIFSGSYDAQRQRQLGVCSVKDRLTTTRFVRRASHVPPSDFYELLSVNKEIWSIGVLRAVRHSDKQDARFILKRLTNVEKIPSKVRLPGGSEVTAEVWTDAATGERGAITLGQHLVWAPFVPCWSTLASRSYVSPSLKRPFPTEVGGATPRRWSSLIPRLLSRLKACIEAVASKSMPDSISSRTTLSCQCPNHRSTATLTRLRSGLSAFLLQVARDAFICAQRLRAEAVPRWLASLYSSILMSLQKPRWLSVLSHRWNHLAAATRARHFRQGILATLSPGLMVGASIRHGLHASGLALGVVALLVGLIDGNAVIDIITAYLLVAPMIFGAWTTPTQRTTGTLISAAIYNTDLVDNLVALRAGSIAIASQAALDIVKASSATQWARLAVGTANQFLRVNSGATDLEWAKWSRCVAYHNTTQTITADGTYYAVALNAEDNDSDTMHDPVANNSRITIPTGGTGFWVVIGTLGDLDVNSGVTQAIRTNGTTLLREAKQGDNEDPMGAVFWAGTLSAADYVQVVAKKAATNFVIGSATRSLASELIAYRVA